MDQGEREGELPPSHLPKLKLPKLCVGLRDGEVSQVAVGTEVAEGKRLPPSLFRRGSYGSGDWDSWAGHPCASRLGLCGDAGFSHPPDDPGNSSAAPGVEDADHAGD